METIFSIISGISLAFAAALTFILFRNLINSKNHIDAESVRFANNTVDNHARISGITSSGKITHHKHTCGGATFNSSDINRKTLNAETTFVFEPKNYDKSYIFVPQTRLHGGGWFA